MSKSNYMVTLSYTVVKTETYLIQNETKEDAIYIAENQNQSPRYDCKLYKETESNPEDESTKVEEVVAKGSDETKDFRWEVIGDKQWVNLV